MTPSDPLQSEKTTVRGTDLPPSAPQLDRGAVPSRWDTFVEALGSRRETVVSDNLGLAKVGAGLVGDLHVPFAEPLWGATYGVRFALARCSASSNHQPRVSPNRAVCRRFARTGSTLILALRYPRVVRDFRGSWETPNSRAGSASRRTLQC